MEHPKLNLGLVGFSATQRMALATMVLAHQNKNRYVKTNVDHCAWQLVDVAEANALLINAARSHEGPHNVLRVYSDADHPSPLGITLSELTLPFAVAYLDALPAHLLPPNKVHAVDVTSYQSVLQALQHFETMLHPLRALFMFAQQMLAWRSELDVRQIYQLVKPVGLLAVVNFPENIVWLKDSTGPADLNGSIWRSHHPEDDIELSGFTAWTLQEASWIFAKHSHEVQLPQRYFEHPIYYRRQLRVRASLLYPRQIELLEQLSRRPLRFQELAALPSIDTAQLKHDLYALYMCRGITTDPRKVLADSAHSGHSGHRFGPSSQATQGNSLEGMGLTTPVGLRTMPAKLI
jgi:hypothetical protein